LSHPFPSRSRYSREPLHRRNGKIRAREVRVLDEEKRQLGVMSLNEALRLAMSKGLDLVEIAPNATPSVCRIVDYGKFMYEESKRHKDTHGRQSASRMKEIQLSPMIDPHDFAIKLGHAIGFLCEDMKVRIKLRFRGRQKAHTEFGFEVVNRFVKEAAPWGQADSPPKMLGDRDLNAILSPLPRNKRAKNPRAAEATEPPKASEPPEPPPASSAPS
jgi:translation initiation factor IF-3